MTYMVGRYEALNIQEKNFLESLSPEVLADTNLVRDILRTVREKPIIDAAIKEVEAEAEAAAEEARQKVLKKARDDTAEHVRKRSRQKQHTTSLWLPGEKSRTKDNVKNSADVAEKNAIQNAEKAAKNAREKVYSAAKEAALLKFYANNRK
eukprot:GDKJ01029082.1.p1 GENE.GDKJ01029082.1~~GDKJ01029082.1.p1  ORF type:complete len:164 (-),score=36.72 GDKJ01029082.1:118-570(-)